MRAFLAMLIANIKMIVRNRQALFWNLLFPAIFIVLFGAIMGGDNFSTFDIGVTGADTPLHQAIVGAMEESGIFNIHAGSEDDELAALRNNDRSLVLVFPEDSSNLQLYTADRPGDISSQIAIGTTRSIITHVLGAGIGVGIDEIRIDALNTRFIDWFMPGIVAMGIMNTGIIGLSTAFVALREQGTLRRIKVTPLPLWQFLSSRVLASMIVAMASSFILIGLGMALFQASVRGNWALITLMIALVSITMLSIGAAVAAIAPNVEAAAGLANLITFPMMFLSGVFFPVDSMPVWMRPIMSVMPLSYGVNVLREPMLYGHGISAIWRDVLILIAIAAVAVILAVRFFRWDSAKK